MKTMVLLLALTCLLGSSSAQIIGMGEGYSSSQLAFFNSPSSSTFEPDVQKYWGNYITSQGNASTKTLTTDMDIWMNTFPMKFDAPMQFSATSFSGNARAPMLSAKERNSQFLTRNVNSNFGYYQIWSYPQESGSLSVSNNASTPSKDAPGKILSQNILTLFNI